MRLFRYMSEQELEKYLSGKTLYNHSDHKGSNTSSVGFCFFNQDDIDPIKAYSCLIGVASVDYLVVFNVTGDAEKQLTKSYGVYRKPEVGNETEQIKLTEYCTTHYNKRDFQLYQAWQLMVPMPVFKFN